MILRFDNINKYFEDFHVLKDVSFQVKSGQIFGFLGRNGAGKTTSLRILMDVFRPDSGDIYLDDEVFNRDDFKIGYLPEERGMYSKSTVKDQLIYFAMLRGANKEQAKASVEYWTHRFEIDEYLNKKLETLSKGNQQKVQITQAFLNEPDILILDEPFSGLDPVNARLFQEALEEYISDDRIIIFSSHQMSYVEAFCDDIAIIDYGRIVLNGNLDEIKHDLGKNQVRLVSDTQDFENYLKYKGHNVSQDKVSYIVALKEGYSLQNLIKDFATDEINLLQLMPYAPSLQDIFIMKVGENDA